MIKKVLKILLCCTLVIPGVSTFANEVNKIDKSTEMPEIVSENVDYWRERIPSYDEYLDKNPNNKLVGENEVYIKYTLNDKTKSNSDLGTTDVYKSKVYTKDEYLKEELQRGIGSFEPDGKEPYWLRLDLQVYEMPNMKNVLMAHSFWEWKTDPILRFTDLNGIYLSDGLLIGSNTPSTPIVSEYITYDEYGNMHRTFNKYDIDDYSKGMAGLVDLAVAPEYLPKIVSHMGMTQAPVIKQRPNSYVSSAISTNYVHKEVALGLPSFDSNGKPSFGLNISSDEHSGSVYVSF
ncbi:hypothetical protein [Clostridium perfringens]|uniref:hypothetical protein n=1 Tax=Clostridium perfringens TaxID=1502 RepID=UPI00156FD856|nr:hypothetical protein [Clostridium perfringens]MDU7125180.1 hypothetical protein [Streptococcus sp.]MDU7977731.1 hypothetical protein [Clostridioides difficile]EGT0690951.1 hypothetical protein [Clostridium perfringens]EGT0694104.1 hypothetical protein [Clostridium perfringens]EGT0697120.1 hypothetical protein [Clostridium perfringens]